MLMSFFVVIIVKLTFFIYFNIIIKQVWIMEINFNNIKSNIKNQSMYDYLKQYHWVEMDKLVNQYAQRVPREEIEFIPFENIVLYSEFATVAGPEIVVDLFRFFSNIDFETVTSWVDDLNERSLLMLDYTLKNFPFNDSIDIADCTLTDLLKSIVGSKGLPDKVAKRERTKYEKIK